MAKTKISKEEKKAEKYATQVWEMFVKSLKKERR